MHEMAIAEGILDIALRQAEQENAARIAEVGLVIGELSGVETEALDFAFSALSKGTAAEGATLTIRRVPLVCRCNKCGAAVKPERYNFFCPHCDGGILIEQSGRELKVEFLEVE